LQKSNIFCTFAPDFENPFMSKREIDQSYFVSFCIEQYKHHASISGDEAAKLLFRTGVAEYLNDNFEVLHTQSRQWLMEEIDERIKQA